MNRRLIVSSVALLLLCAAIALVALNDDEGEKRWNDFARMVSTAAELTAEEAANLETRLELDAHDLQARGQLVVYHALQLSGPEHARRHREHVLWFIRNAPQAHTPAFWRFAQIHPYIDPDSYVAGKRVWVRHLEQEPTNVALLGNAANSLSEIVDLDLVIGIRQQIQTLDPENWSWPFELGQLYLRVAMFGDLYSGGFELPGDPELPANLAEMIVPRPGDGSTGHALVAMDLLQRANELAESDLGRTPFLEDIAEAAFHARRYEDARNVATAVLSRAMLSREDRGPDAYDESRIHRANIILGRLALIDDDVESARFRLLEAGRVTEPPAPGSSYPKMGLAADLLERGEKDVVLEYLELCSKVWPSDELAEWTALVEDGSTPDFPP